MLFLYLHTACLPIDSRNTKFNETINKRLYSNYSLPALRYEYSNIKEQYSQNFNDSVIYKNINNHLCEELEKQLSNCSINRRINPNFSFNFCKSNTFSYHQAPSIKVETISNSNMDAINPNHKFYFLINDTIESSNIYLDGRPAQKIEFYDDQNTFSPKFSEIYKIELKNTSSNFQFPSDFDVTFKFYINNEEIMSMTPKTIQQYRVILKTNISESLKSSRCVYSLNDIEKDKVQITSEINKLIQNHQFKDLANERCLLKNFESLPQDQLVNTLNECTLVNKNLKDQINHALDTQLILINSLQTDKVYGCMKNQSVKSFKMQLSGAYRNNIFVLDGLREKRVVDKNPNSEASELYFDFGGINFTIDFSKNNYFNGSEYIFEGKLTNTLIKDFNQVYISKKAITYNNVAKKCKDVKGIFGSIERLISDPTCYTLYENAVFDIESIKIIINDNIIFHQYFENNTLNYRNTSFKSVVPTNQAWIQLMKKTRCE